eukprot:Skav217003  [mRNA]  locus=scaffold1803:80466:82544:+ [translate_table: standard]
MDMEFGQDLKRAIKGEIGMSQAAFNVDLVSMLVSCYRVLIFCASHFQELDVLGGSMFNGRGPEERQRLQLWKSTDPCRDWAEKGDPAVFWLSGFHIPESLLSLLPPSRMGTGQVDSIHQGLGALSRAEEVFLGTAVRLIQLMPFIEVIPVEAGGGLVARCWENQSEPGVGQPPEVAR